jgi:hypothetical protein
MKRGNVPTRSESGKSAVFLMESALTSHGSSKSNKKPSDGRGILDYLLQGHLFYKATYFAIKKWPCKGVASLEGDNLVVFYCLNVSEIRHTKRGGPWWEWHYKRVTTVFATIYCFLYTYVTAFQCTM